MRIVAIVLAAGEGQRIGGTKALLPLADGTFLAHLCRLFRQMEVDEVVVVLGAEAERVRSQARMPEDIVSVVNEDWRSGMLSSLWRGLDVAESLGADAVLVHPVDNPFVSSGAVRSVMDALRAGARIAVPSHAGRRGHPAGFARSVFSALRSAPPESGARQVLADNPAWVVHLEAGPDCLYDVDTPEDLAAHPGRTPNR